MKISPETTDRTVKALVELYVRAVRMVPPSVGLPMGRMLGFLACAADAKHRDIARINLKFALGGEKSDQEIDRLVYRNFMQWGMIAYEWGRMRVFHRRPPGRLPVPISLSGEHHLRAARAKSPAVLLLSAHFGNWEYGHLHYAGNINPLNFIVRRIDNPHVEKLRVAANHHHGVTILYKEKGLKKAIKHLKQGEDLVIFADQKANRKEGVACRFFGRQTMTLPIVAALAKKYQYPIVPMFVVREKMSAAHKIVFLPELTYDDGDSIESIAQRQNDVIEAMIRKHPDHWLWMHRRWKTEYPQIYQTG
jgi:Kdo2-lipid IVA lauroyltransferase/acyltransferase